MRGRSLSLRLLLANLAVVTVGAVALVVTVSMLGPRLFDTQVERIGLRYGWANDGTSPGGGPGRDGGSGQQATAVEAELNAAFTHSLAVALGVAVGAGAIAAIAGAVLVARGVLRPLDRMRVSVRRMAEGHYDERVPEPRDRELADLARDVNALGSVLKETEQRRARLVSDLAHELRTPITSLDGFVEGLEDGVFEADAETLGAMRGETRRLLRLAIDLSVLSRADEQAFDLHVEEADLGAIASQAARGLAAAFAAAEATLAIVPGPDLPVRADPDRMSQVFANLLRNALQYTPAGGTVTLAGERRGAFAAMTVTDTGEGIAPEHLGHVFDRFFRIDGAAPAAGGTGIGLTIARGITRAHGGDIAAASPGIGRGAMFTVTLPLRS
jgi:signal transduction histidine kinase